MQVGALNHKPSWIGSLRSLMLGLRSGRPFCVGCTDLNAIRSSVMTVIRAATYRRLLGRECGKTHESVNVALAVKSAARSAR